MLRLQQCRTACCICRMLQAFVLLHGASSAARTQSFHTEAKSIKKSNSPVVPSPGCSLPTRIDMQSIASQPQGAGKQATWNCFCWYLGSSVLAGAVAQKMLQRVHFRLAAELNVSGLQIRIIRNLDSLQVKNWKHPGP